MLARRHHPRPWSRPLHPTRRTRASNRLLLPGPDKDRVRARAAKARATAVADAVAAKAGARAKAAKAKARADKDRAAPRPVTSSARPAATLHSPARGVHTQATSTPGPARFRCGHTAAPRLHRRPSLPPSTAFPTVHRLAAAPSTAAVSRTPTGAGAVRPPRSLPRRINRRPGTLPKAEHGTRTRWRTTSAP